MSEPYGYTGGTITLTANSAAVTGALTAWLDLLPGDEIVQGTNRAVIDAVNSNTSLTLRSGWPGASYTGAAYVVLYRSALRHDVSRLSERYARWHRSAVYVIETTGEPDNAVGSDGWLAFDNAASAFYRKASGAWSNAISLKGAPGELTRSGTVALAQLAAWAGADSSQLRAATAAEVQTAAGMSAFFQSLVTGGSSYSGFLDALGMRLNVGTVADDAVSVIDFGAAAYGLLLIATTAYYAVRPGLYHFRAAEGPQFGTIAEYSGVGAAPATKVYTTALVGTTGTDGALNLGVDATGKLYFENRRGFAVAITAYALRV